MIDQMLKGISTQLKISQGETESADNWKARVIYSSIGLQMLAATFDHDEPLAEDDTFDKSVSMQHVLLRGKQLEGVYNKEFSWEHRNRAEYIRSIYIATGHMLHKSNRLTYPPLRCASDATVMLSRGVLPWTVNGMCGLGFLSTEAPSSTNQSIYDMFHLQKMPIAEWFAAMQKNIVWKRIESLPSHVEYLNITGKEKSGYWTGKPPVQGLALCRYEENRERAYRLLRLSESIEQFSMPSWQVENREYIRVALALKTLAGNPPVLTIRRDGSIAHLDASYLLPPSEQYFFELYSWPTNESLHWRRVTSTQLLPLLVNIYTHQGFNILEV